MIRPSAAEIEARLKLRCCIWCGVVAVVDAPYICKECLIDIAADIAARKAKETEQ